MAERKPIIPPGISPNPALSPGIQVGDTLYVSGQIAVDASGNVVGENDCEAQTREVMANIDEKILLAPGASGRHDQIRILINRDPTLKIKKNRNEEAAPIN